MTYEITGIFKGRRYRYQTSDYDWAFKTFKVNNFKSFWSIDKDGKRKLLSRQGK